MRLEFVSREAADRLARDVPNNLEAYRTGKTAELIRDNDRRISRLEVPDPPELESLGDDPGRDAEAARRIYQWLSDLDPAQAADERLWIFLTHVQFANYTHLRWRSGLARAKDPRAQVKDRWFFRGDGLRTKTHNAISRLWWLSHISQDAARADPFELTDVLLSLQDLQTAFAERSIGGCHNLLASALEVFDERNRLAHCAQRGDVVKAWAKSLHFYGGVTIIDVVPKERLRLVASFRLETALRESQQAAMPWQIGFVNPNLDRDKPSQPVSSPF